MKSCHLNNSWLYKKLFLTLLWLAFSLFAFANANAASRIKDLVEIKGMSEQQLIGYSLVVGLNGTGDSRRSAMTVQAARNMMMKFGMNMPQNELGMRNVASVMITADISPFVQEGSKVDVVVSSIGDATSLEGGTLLLTPLIGQDSQVYAHAQGPVSIGGFNIETMSGERLRKNFALAGRVPAGAIIERALQSTFMQEQNLELLLREPDFTSAVRIAEAINTGLGSQIAKPADPGRVVVQLADANQAMPLVSKLESLEVDADQEARVVINERTGTVVVGHHVRLTPPAVAPGNKTKKVSYVHIV